MKSMSYRLFLASSILSVLVTACGNTPAAQSTVIPVPSEAQTVVVAPAHATDPTSADLRLPPAGLQAVEQARTDLAQRLGIGPESIEVLSAEHRVTASARVDGAGWWISLLAGEQRYQYFVNAAGTVRFIQ